MKLIIQRNLYIYMGTLLKARERFEDNALEQKKNQQEQSGDSEPGL